MVLPLSSDIADLLTSRSYPTGREYHIHAHHKALSSSVPSVEVGFMLVELGFQHLRGIPYTGFATKE